MNRKRLPQRRETETMEFDQPEGASTIRYRASLGMFGDGTLAEVFLNSHKIGTSSDTNARDGAVAISLALQYGCPAQTLRHAMCRNPDGTAMGPLGRILDLASEKEKPHAV